MQICYSYQWLAPYVYVFVYLCADYVSSEASLTVHTPATHFGTAPARVSLTEGSIGPGPASMVRYCTFECKQDMAISAPRAWLA